MNFLLLAVTVLVTTISCTSAAVVSSDVRPGSALNGLVIDNNSHYEILLDAGSTGTRIYIYGYHIDDPILSLVEVAHRREIPALSSFYNNAIGLQNQMNILLEFAKAHVPNELWSNSTIALKATAGLRSIPVHEQDWLLVEVKQLLNETGFNFVNEDTKVIEGEEEALYDLMAIMAASYSKKFLIYGLNGEEELVAADLGGSSQQVAFFSNNDDCVPDWKIELPISINEKTGPFYIFAKSISKLGLIAAMDRTLETYYSENRSNSTEVDVSGDISQAFHPCIPPGEFPADGLPVTMEAYTPIHGSGDYHRCKEVVRQVLVPPAKDILSSSCINRMKSRAMTFIGMDNFPKALEVLSLSNYSSINPFAVDQAGVAICQRPWRDVLNDHPPGFQPYRAQRSCFAAAFISVFLTDIFGIDSQEKYFLPLDNIKGTSFNAEEIDGIGERGEHVHTMELSWTLGAAFLAASGARKERIYK